jgi:hypothetical protein
VRSGLTTTAAGLAGVLAYFLWQLTNKSLEAEDGGAAAAATARATIMITINPEARVSVTRIGSQSALGSCGVAMKLTVEVLNQAYLTAPLQAFLVGSVAEGVKVEFLSEPLKGLAKEERTLFLTLRDPGPTDLTISFRAKNEAPDLGGRDRIHLLAQCKR